MVCTQIFGTFWPLTLPPCLQYVAIIDTWGINFFYDLGLRIGREGGFIRVRVRTTRLFQSSFFLTQILDYIRGGQRWVGLGSQRAKRFCFPAKSVFCLPQGRPGDTIFFLPLLLGMFYFFLHDFKASANANRNSGIPHSFLVFLNTFNKVLKTIGNWNKNLEF